VKSFDEVTERAKQLGPKTVAVSGQPGEEFTTALAAARREGYIDKVLICREATEAVRAVRTDAADILLKGTVDTKTFITAVLDKDNGLRTGRLISHVAVVEAFGRFILITDAGICLHPNLEQKAEIIRNSIPVAHALGIKVPKVAVLAAVEKVNPKMPETVDAQKLSAMNIPGCVVQGPLAVDNAISPEAAARKGIDGPVAGHADVLICPNVLAGNIFAKGIMYFSDRRWGGIVAGTSHPVAFLSRADSAQMRLDTIALGVVLGEELHHA